MSRPSHDQWCGQARRAQERRRAHHLRVDRADLEVYSKVPIQDPRMTWFGEIRGQIRMRVELEGKSLVCYHAHAYPQFHYGAQGFQWRNEQLLEGVGELPSDEGPRMVVGDLNVDPWSPHYRAMMKRSGLNDARRGFGLNPSQGRVIGGRLRPLLSRPIDHVLVSPGVVVTDFRLGPFLGSDHLPVIAELAF